MSSLRVSLTDFDFASEAVPAEIRCVVMCPRSTLCNKHDAHLCHRSQAKLYLTLMILYGTAAVRCYAVPS